MIDIIKAVRQFTEAVGCTTDRYNVRQTALYIGLQLEEMAEKLDAIATPQESGIISTELRKLVNLIHDASSEFKFGRFDALVERSDRAAMLDADIDLAWVTIGSAFSQGADVEGAAGEVTRANLSKLVQCPAFVCANGERVDGKGKCENCNGTGFVVIKDENGKVCKPKGWVAPNIESFVCKDGSE